ncbi:ABC transporter permease [Maledivibacter halophilus]|uniref:Putative ABC transport system permease protein n=1 Tax=Maledivibacter halophilus TaxID=36842 RepID=A0A1T5IQQ0_9FIRM|nr:ABC transporter permease [Maledivibacter halophilus]SKC41412.1 putative ABC transport system permease protein [Maledivibacter halophilus]
MQSKRKRGSFLVRWWFTTKMALHGILANPLRSALTILGVAIGVASVVSLMGIGEGARRAVVEQFESLGSNVVTITANDPSVEFDPDYGEELVERVQGLEAATPVVNTKANIKWRRTRGKIDVVGVGNEFPSIRDHELAMGHFFTKAHVDQRIPVAVLGYNVGTSLLGGRNPIGKSISLNGSTFRIIGVLNFKGEGKANDIDNKIVVPYSSALKIAEKRTVDAIWGKAASEEDADLVIVQLGRIFRRKLGLDQNAPSHSSSGQEQGPSGNSEMGPDSMESMEPSGPPMSSPEPAAPNPILQSSGDELISITSLNQLVQEADKANRVMTLLLGGIAAVSLLVGGLGIMNIMLVSVTERRTEIGVRRALGAKQTDLLLQFLLEALYVSVIGAISGIAAGIWGLSIFEGQGFQTAVSLNAIKIATVVALSSGLLFGVYPAISASSVPPVEALRSQ